MILAHYIKENKIHVGAFAQSIGVTRNTVYRYINKKDKPRPKVMESIVSITKGAVQPNDFFDLNPEAITGDHTTITQQNHVEPGGKHAGK